MVDGLLTRRAGARFSSAKAKAKGRAPAAAAAFLSAIAAFGAPASAITLETYFLQLNDRERGAYMTGFIELFANDATRDDDYRACVAETGAAGLHDALTDVVLGDPRMLTYEAAPWILYTAATVCKAPGAKPPPVPAQTERVDAAAAGSEPPTAALAGLPAQEAEAAEPTSEFGGRGIAWVVAGAAGGIALGMLGGAFLGRARRKKS